MIFFMITVEIRGWRLAISFTRQTYLGQFKSGGNSSYFRWLKNLKQKAFYFV